MKTNNLPKPSAEVYKNLMALQEELNTSENVTPEISDNYFKILSEYNWSPEVTSENGKFGLKNWAGKQIVPNEFDAIPYTPNFLIADTANIIVNKAGKEGIIQASPEGYKWLLTPEFDFITNPHGFVGLCKDSKWGIMDLSSMNFLRNMDCDEVHTQGRILFMNNVVTFKKDNKYGILNHFGDITDTHFDEIAGEFEGCVQARIGDTWGYIKQDGSLTDDTDEAAFDYYQ